MTAHCSQCGRVESPGAIEAHNRRCATNGERSYDPYRAKPSPTITVKRLTMRVRMSSFEAARLLAMATKR